MIAFVAIRRDSVQDCINHHLKKYDMLN